MVIKITQVDKPHSGGGDPIVVAYTSSEMKRAFALVAEPTDWRAPINALIDDRDLAHHCVTVSQVVLAIEFYTATVPSVSVCEYGGVNHYTIQAAGYRAGPAGP